MTEKEYNKVRHTIRTSDVFFTASPALFSKLIRFFTKSKVSHTGLFVWIGKRLFIAEAMEGEGICLKLASGQCERFEAIGRIKHNQTSDDVIEYVLSRVGVVGYDLIGAIVSLFYDTKSKNLFCSEFVKNALCLPFPQMKAGIKPIDIANAVYFWLYPSR